MNCETAGEYIFTYDMISGQERQELHRHLSSCDSCQHLFEEQETFRMMIADVSKEEIEPVDSSRLTNNIMQKIGRRKPNPSGILHWFGLLRWGMTAVSVCLVLLFIVQTGVDEPKTNSGLQSGAILQPRGKEILRERKKKPEFSLYAKIKSNNDNIRL